MATVTRAEPHSRKSYVALALTGVILAALAFSLVPPAPAKPPVKPLTAAELKQLSKELTGDSWTIPFWK